MRPNGKTDSSYKEAGSLIVRYGLDEYLITWDGDGNPKVRLNPVPHFVPRESEEVKYLR